MGETEKRKKKYCAVIALVAAVLITGIVTVQRGLLAEAKEAKLQRQIAKEVFRFHVLANSDTDEDQALKMKVKEAIISYLREELPHAGSVGMTKQWVCTHLEDIQEVAKKVLRQERYTYPIHAEVTNCYFPEKTYGDVTFPKGTYEALRIEIGNAKGQNWWCVLYPNLCFIDAVHAVVPKEGKEELKEVLEEEAYEMVTATSKFKVKWFFFP